MRRFSASARAIVASVAALGAPAVARADGFLDQADCTKISGWAETPGDKTTSIEVKLTFDGAASDPGVVQHPVLADLHRDDLCATYGCEHGFVTTVPLTLLDGFEHTVHAYESDGADGVGAELTTSPKKFTCALELPAGVKRKLPSDDAMAAWHFSPFWDEISVSDGIVGAYPDGAALPATPSLMHTTAAPDTLFIADVTRSKAAVRRPVGDALAAAAWDFHASQAMTIDEATLAATPEAAPLRARPFVLRGPDGALYAIDDDIVDSPAASGSGGGGGGDTGPTSSGTCSCRDAGAVGESTTPFWIGAAFAAGIVARARRRKAAVRVA